IGPLARICRGVGTLSEADRLVIAIVVGQVGRPESGLGLSVDILAGLRQELVNVAAALRKGLRQDARAAHRERKSAAASLHQIAVDVLVMAKARLQDPLELPN